MLKKIIAVKNIGRFRNSAAPGNPQLAKHTLIQGANGYGKTTLCAVFRSLQTGDASYVLGRKTLGSTSVPSVELLLDSGPSRFDGQAWSAPNSAIAIFDGIFVAENVHSGEIVDLDHKRNLYRVIIGAEGVKLAEEDSELAGESRAKTGEIAAAAKAIQPHIPAGMKLETFLALPLAGEIDTQIADQERTVESARQASTIRDRALLSPYVLPTLPAGFMALLTRTIDDIAQDAERQLADHLTRHGMTNAGGWIATGTEHAGETCPFCGQDIRGLPLIAAFRAVFSAGYKGLASDIAAMKAAATQALGDAALARLDTVREQNKAGAEFWSKYCAIEAASFDLPPQFGSKVRALGTAASALVERKASAPLDVVRPDDNFAAALAELKTVIAGADAANAAIHMANQLITDKKTASRTADVKSAEVELARRRAVKARHTEAVDILCTTYNALVAQKADIEKKKETVRSKLETHTKSVVEPYEKRINDYLTAFNAGFRITETKHAFPGGIATSSYQLVINENKVDLGDSKTPGDRPSFKNTLSAGDRTTLALAFFLAHLDCDPGIGRKLVVFDDPFNSQDAFRRRQTVHEIMKVARKCAQVIVLSHDATFLRQIWEKSGSADRVSLAIVDHRAQGSKLLAIDLEAACRGRTATDIDDLQNYLSTGAGALLDISRKMRVVLETHCRTTYPNSFLATDWLGDIVRKIREGGDVHPAQALYDELDQINDYTSQYHHGEDVGNATPDQIDPTELTGYARRTLCIVNALQA